MEKLFGTTQNSDVVLTLYDVALLDESCLNRMFSIYKNSAWQ